MKIKYSIFFSILALNLVACKEAAFLQYEDTDRLQFGPDDPKYIYSPDYEKNSKYRDTTKSFSFYFEEEDIRLDTVFFNVYTLGQVKNYDRKFKLVQIQEEGKENALSDIHYRSFDNPESNLVVKAGQSYARIPIILYRDPSLKEREFILKFQIEANDNFQLGAESNLWRKINITDRLSMPTYWTRPGATSPSFGKYSVIKHQFMISISGLRWDGEFMKELSIELISFWRTEFNKALRDYNNLHPKAPLTDEFNEEVVF